MRTRGTRSPRPSSARTSASRGRRCATTIPASTLRNVAPTSIEQDWVREGKPVPARELDLRPTRQNHGPELKFQAADLDAHDGDATVDDHDDVELAEDGDKRWSADFEVDDDDVAVSLDYRFTDPGDGD